MTPYIHRYDCPRGSSKRSHFPAFLGFLPFGDEFLGKILGAQKTAISVPAVIENHSPAFLDFLPFDDEFLGRF